MEDGQPFPLVARRVSLVLRTVSTTFVPFAASVLTGNIVVNRPTTLVRSMFGSDGSRPWPSQKIDGVSRPAKTSMKD